MDYRIRRKKSELKGTGYIEIGPGKVPLWWRKKWRDGNLLILEEAFTIATGILVNHYSDYNHFGPNELPKDVGIKITTEWREVANQLNYMSESQVRHALNLDGLGKWVDIEISSNKADIIIMLRDLADRIDELYTQKDQVYILGV
jgi:hypothetical protein